MEERKVGFEKRAMADILLRSISTSHETLLVVVVIVVVVTVVVVIVVVGIVDSGRQGGGFSKQSALTKLEATDGG